jgi:flagellar protein FlbD
VLDCRERAVFISLKTGFQIPVCLARQRTLLLIKLHRLDGKEIVINADLIETIQAVPDTLIVLTTSNKLVVTESVDKIISLIHDYRRAIGGHPPHSPTIVDSSPQDAST